MSVIIRVLPPANGATTTINGRAYTCAAGSSLDVVDFDAWQLMANGWTAVAGSVGTTAQRPVSPPKNTTYQDTTLGYQIVFDGAKWRNPSTAAAV